MTIQAINPDTGKPVLCGDTVKGMYGEPWIFLALSSPMTVWVRDPITGTVIDFDPASMVIDINVNG